MKEQTAALDFHPHPLTRFPTLVFKFGSLLLKQLGRQYFVQHFWSQKNKQNLKFLSFRSINRGRRLRFHLISHYLHPPPPSTIPHPPIISEEIRNWYERLMNEWFFGWKIARFIDEIKVLAVSFPSWLPLGSNYFLLISMWTW